MMVLLDMFQGITATALNFKDNWQSEACVLRSCFLVPEQEEIDAFFTSFAKAAHDITGTKVMPVKGKDPLVLGDGYPWLIIGNCPMYSEIARMTGIAKASKKGKINAVEAV